MSRKPQQRAARRRGFTLAEVLAAAAVLTLAVAAIAQAVSAGQTTTYRALDELRAQFLAEAMIEEVLAKPYADPDGASTPGPENGESNRSKFDNADDYDGYHEDPGDIEDAQGEAYPAVFQGFGRTVAAAYVTQTVAGFSADIAGLNITVTITGPRGETWTFSRFRPELEDSVALADDSTTYVDEPVDGGYTSGETGDTSGDGGDTSGGDSGSYGGGSYGGGSYGGGHHGGGGWH